MRDNNIGKMGEKLVYDLFKNSPIYNIKDTSDIKEYQKEDVDFLLTKKKDSNVNIGIEVKTDTYTSGNMAYEVVSNSKTGAKGCFEKTAADYIFYYFINLDCLYVFNTQSLRRYANSGRYKLRDFVTTKKGNYEYHSSGYIIKLSEIENNLAAGQDYIKFDTKKRLKNGSVFIPFKDLNKYIDGVSRPGQYVYN